MEIVLARYKNRGKVCTFDAADIKCKKGDNCIVECKEELSNIRIIVPNMQFKRNSKEFTKILRKDSDEDLIQIDKINETEDKAYEVHIIEIDDEYRGKNIAGEAYELIGNELKNKGYSFTSDQLRTMEPSAIRVWEKLVQKGLASKSEDNYTFK